MPLSVKVDSLDRYLKVLIDQKLSPAAQSATLAEYARERLADGEQTNQQALGYIPPHDTIVDGRVGAEPETVKPNGVIVFQFNLLEDVFRWIGEQLVLHSPVGGGADRHPGQYQKSHRFFADGVEVDPGGPAPRASQYVFLSTVPYARKIESGSSPQAPDGVYQAVATMAARQFGNIAKITFSYEAPFGDEASELEKWARSTSSGRFRRNDREDWLRRVPAIVITLR